MNFSKNANLFQPVAQSNDLWWHMNRAEKSGPTVSSETYFPKSTQVLYQQPRGLLPWAVRFSNEAISQMGRPAFQCLIERRAETTLSNQSRLKLPAFSPKHIDATE